MGKSTGHSPIRQVGVYVGHIFGGQISSFGLPIADFIVSGKPDIHSVDRLLKRYDREDAVQQAKPKDKRDYSKRNVRGRSIMEFLYTKAGLRVPKISPKGKGGLSFQMGYKDDTKSCSGNTALAAFKEKHGYDFLPYKPVR